MEQELSKKFKPVGRTKVINGTIIAPENSGLRFVLSFTNLAGKPESPLFPLFEKKWRKVREECRAWYATKTGAYKLGATSNTAVQSDVWVINMLCQDESLKVDIKGLEECLKKVSASALYEKASIHISSVLLEAAPELKDLATKYFTENGVSVSYYQES